MCTQICNSTISCWRSMTCCAKPTCQQLARPAACHSAALNATAPCKFHAVWLHGVPSTHITHSSVARQSCAFCPCRPRPLATASHSNVCSTHTHTTWPNSCLPPSALSAAPDRSQCPVSFTLSFTAGDPASITHTQPCQMTPCALALLSAAASYDKSIPPYAPAQRHRQCSVTIHTPGHLAACHSVPSQPLLSARSATSPSHCAAGWGAPALHAQR